MIKVQPPISTRPTAVRTSAAKAPDATPPVPQDHGVAVVPSPWPVLDRAGLLSATAAVPGPVGSRLNDESRRGLLDVLTRLDEAGVHLSRHRRFYVPLLMKKYVPLTPQQAVDLVSKETPVFGRPLMVSGDKTTNYPVKSLADLQVLDGLHLSGAACGAPNSLLIESLRGLQSHGFRTLQRVSSDYYTNEVYVDSLAAYRHAVMPDNGENYAYMIDDHEDKVHPLATNIVAMDFFAGSGQDHGLSDPVLARGLKDLTQRDYRISGVEEGRSACSAYLSAVTSGSKPIQVRRGKEPFFPVTSALLANPAGVEARADEVKTLGAKFLDPLVKQDQVTRNDADAVWQKVYEGESQTPVETRVEHLALLMEAEAVSEAKDKDRYRQPFQDAVDDLDKIDKNVKNPADKQRAIQELARLLKAGGKLEAMETLDYVEGTLRKSSFDAAEYEQSRDLFFSLIESTHSADLARRGMDLLPIQIGSESPGDRVKLFKNIADHESENTLSRTVSDYEKVLANRLPGETMTQTGDRFVSILQALAIGRNQERATEVFEYVQKGASRKAFGTLDAAGATQKFIESLVLTRNIDLAMSKLRGYSDPGSIAGVKDGDGSVSVGGIKLPKKPSEV